jgi:hypothetical protein
MEIIVIGISKPCVPNPQVWAITQIDMDILDLVVQQYAMN